MNPEQIIENAISLLHRLRKLLIQNKGIDFVPGVELVLEQLKNENFAAIEKLSKASRIYRGLMRGAGSLGDFAIWNTDSELSNTLNNELEAVFRSLWDIFNNPV